MKAFIESGNFKSEAEALNQKIYTLNNQVALLELQIAELKKSPFSIEKLKAGESATKFYTGFPYFSSLLATFGYFEPKLSRMHYWRGKQSSCNTDLEYHEKSSLKPDRKRTLSHLEEFVLVLMRLKVGLFVADLSDRFGISPGQVSKIFTTWICFCIINSQLYFRYHLKTLYVKICHLSSKISPQQESSLIVLKFS